MRNVLKGAVNVFARSAWAVAWAVLILLLVVAGSVTESSAQDAVATPEKSEAEEARINELEEKVKVIAEELGRLESIFTVPEEVALDSFSGLGPAASKVYKRDKGLSIGGYGEVRLRSFVDQEDDNEDDVFDALRAVLYVGYKFNDKWVFNSELEFEHAGTGGGGSVSTEFLTIDYLARAEINFRAGLLLVPMGFINEIHEPTFFYGAERPEVERLIMPSTWRENGLGIFGTVAERVSYRFYVINGFEGEKFSSGGLRGGRQKGSRALANDFAFVGRIDVADVGVNGLLLGGSVYTGQSGQEQDIAPTLDEDDIVLDPGGQVPDLQTTIYEIHAQYKGHGASLRALWTQAFIDGAGSLSRLLQKDPDESIASEMRGWYVEVAYDVLPLFLESNATLEPYFRYENFDTQRKVSNGNSRVEGVNEGRFEKDQSKNVDLYVAGIQYKPIPQVVFKLDYRHFDPRQGHRANEVQALVGYVF